MRTETQEFPPAEFNGRPVAARTRLDKVSARRCKAASTAGTSILEFAFVVPAFLLLLFALIDFSRLFYVQLTLQNAVRQAGRYAITGNHMPDPKHQGQNLSRVNSIIQIAQNAAQGLDVSAIQVSSRGGGEGSAGGPGDTVTISLSTNLKLITAPVAHFFQNGTYTFTVSVSFKNESFPPNNTT
jgi:Flp pilus assembly protein TadG